MNAAYQAAQCGDVVNIDAGTYGDQNIMDKTALDSCSQPVVFQAAPGLSRSQVVLGNDAQNSIDTGDSGNPASDFTVQNVTVTSNITLLACNGNTASCSNPGPSHNVTINNVQGGSLFINANNVTVENSNLGPCYNLISLPSGQTNNNGYPGPSYSPNPAVKCNSNIKIAGGSGLVFKNNVVHDFLDDDSNGAYNHFECMFVAAGSNITIDSNKFYDCQIYSIMIQDFGGPITGLTIENNWIWANQGGMLGCTSNGNCPAENAGGTDEDAINFANSDNQTTNVLIRYNSFDPCCGIGQEGSVIGANTRAMGNILGPAAGHCISGITFSYNLWESGQSTCGTGDRSTSTNPFVTTGNYGSTLDDLHLGPSPCTSNPAANLVTPNTSDYQLNYDIDNNARNTSGPRDAGASAQTSCGT